MRAAPIAPLLILTAVTGCAADGGAEPPPERAVAPPLAPPPARPDALSREDVLERARAGEPDDAIRDLDAHPFAFALDEPALAWFGRQGVDPAVLDYLRKRARVDWESLRGDVDPEGGGAD